MAVILTDIDGTLTTSGDTLRASVVGYLQRRVAAGDDVIAVSARLMRRMAETEDWLDAHDLPVTAVYLNDRDDTAPAVALAFKRATYTELLDEYGEAIALAIDDDPAVRRMAAELGIEAVAPQAFEERGMAVDDMGSEARSAGGRSLKAMPCSYKALRESSREFEGYGSVFGVVDSYQDVVLPGAFAATLEKATATGRMPAMLWQHDPSQVIGVWRVMVEDSRGLYVMGELADTQLGREAYALLKLGALSGLSIGYSVTGDRYDRERDVRELTGIELWETSLVTFPANGESRVQAVKEAPTTYRGLERILREAGFSRSEAKAIASGGMRALREAVPADLSTEEAAALRALYA